VTLLWLPTATRRPLTGQPGFAWQVDCPPKGVLHTTEGGNGIPDYTPGLKAPHATVVPHPGVGVTPYQHIPFDRASYSLVHNSGTAPTNGAHAFQFELAGTSDPAGAGYHWPTADDAVLRDLLAKVILPLQDAFGIPLVAPPFMAYPASYGLSSVRLRDVAWLGWRGWVGHEHVPSGNVHGDPGAFPWARLVALAGGHVDPPKPPTHGGIPAQCQGIVYGPVQYGQTDPGGAKAGRDNTVKIVQWRVGLRDADLDGIYGRGTMRAVEMFQAHHGLTTDGVVGPATCRRFDPATSYAAR
jgi:hypothetical protein